MASEVEIANRAITKLGGERITSMLDDNENARNVNYLFAPTREYLLRTFVWSFAKARTQLAASATAPAFGYTTSYPLPSDCLRILMVGTYFPLPNTSDFVAYDDSAWAIEGRSILINATGALPLIYTRNVEDTGQWDASFVEVMAARLAYELAEPMTKSAPKKQAAFNDYRMALVEAARANALELPPRYMADGALMASRY